MIEGIVKFECFALNGQTIEFEAKIVVSSMNYVVISITTTNSLEFNTVNDLMEKMSTKLNSYLEANNLLKRAYNFNRFVYGTLTEYETRFEIICNLK